MGEVAMLEFNETKVCEIIVRLLEAREDQARSDVFRPEAINHLHPVEMTWKLGSQLYALEHTGIEPFEEHVRLEAESQRHFDPILKALAGALPSGVFELLVPAKAMLHRSRAEVAQIQSALIGWIKRAAPPLGMRRSGD
jgi:hypothetical protein